RSCAALGVRPAARRSPAHAARSLRFRLDASVRAAVAVRPLPLRFRVRAVQRRQRDLVHDGSRGHRPALPGDRTVGAGKPMTQARACLLSINNYFYPRGGAEVLFLEQNRMLEGIGWQVVPFAMRHADNLPTPWASYFPDEIELGRSYSLGAKLLN